MKSLKRVAVTGGGGQVAYHLMFRIASGEVFGKDQPIALHIHDLPQQCETVMRGVVMELEDGCFPLLKEICVSSELDQVFEGVNVAFLIGSKPRGPGMERKDLLLENGTIFVEQGRSLNKMASKDVIVFVVGNPCNTNCLIAMHHAPNIPKEQFHAMTRLDHNRAIYQLAKKANVSVKDVTNVTIWGNHSSTQVPDFLHAKIGGKRLQEVIQDEAWLEKDFFSLLQKRGSAIIEARGKSSAASAAQAIIDGIQDIEKVTEEGKWFSSCIYSDKNPYGIKKDLVFSFPCFVRKDKKVDVVSGLDWDDFLQKKIAITEKELFEEKEMVAHLLKEKSPNIGEVLCEKR
jgi:malate dehydrogenase